MLFVGESINGTRKAVREAIINHDEAFIVDLARSQVEAGSNMLDVNAGTGHGSNEVEDLAWLVKLVQANVDVPLCIDSSDPKAIENALKLHKGVALINSISGEQVKLDALLPVVAANHCMVVALCIGNAGIPKTAEERFEIARKVVGELEQAGVKREDIFVDPIVMSVATETGAGAVTLETIALTKKGLPGTKSILAVSNVGFGLPNRTQLNRYFAALAVERGIDALLGDIRDKSMIASAVATQALMGNDPYCGNYLKSYRNGRLG